MESSMGKNRNRDFGMVLASAVDFLRELPRSDTEIATARRQSATWAASHPQLSARLVVDVPPGSVNVNFDVLLDHPDGGTVAISFAPDGDLPWSVYYAD